MPQKKKKKKKKKHPNWHIRTCLKYKAFCDIFHSWGGGGGQQKSLQATKQ